MLRNCGNFSEKYHASAITEDQGTIPSDHDERLVPATVDMALVAPWTAMDFRSGVALGRAS